MKIGKLYLGLLLVIIPFLQGLQCDKDVVGNGDPRPQYTFKEKVSVQPYKLNYSIGDTIWLDVNVAGKRLYDERTSQRVLYDSVAFTSIAQVDLLYNNPFIGDGPFAKLVYPTGIAAHTNNSLYQTSAFITYGCSNATDYRLKVGIILLKPGVFGVSFFNSSITECLTGHFRSAQLFYELDVTDTHKQFYLQQPLSNIGKKPDEVFLNMLDRKAMVVVQVQ